MYQIECKGNRNIKSYQKIYFMRNNLNQIKNSILSFNVTEEMFFSKIQVVEK